MHIHSIASGHSVSTVDEIIRHARSKKMTHVGITEHGPSMEGAPHQGYFWISDKLPSSFGRLKVFYGCEANIIDTEGNLDLEEHLRTQSIVIAGLHEKTPYPRNLSRQQNTSAIINSMKRRCVSMISHPIRPEFPIEVDDLVSAAAENNVILELNTQLMRSIVNTDHVEKYKRMVGQAKKQGAKLIVNSDAHARYFIGDDFVLRKLGKILRLSRDDLLNFDHKYLEKTLEMHKNG